MAEKIIKDDGSEVEVYTAAEKQAEIDLAVAKAKEDFGKTEAELKKERDEARTALASRTGEFAQFRKLSAETVAKLSEAERTIYENGLALQEEREKHTKINEENEKKVLDSFLRAKAGGDEKLFDKMKELWGIIGIQTVTPEDMENKAKMVMGAIGTTQPDLLASVGGFSGGAFVPKKITQENASFADSDRGQQGMKELGLDAEIKKATPKKEE